MILQVPVDCAVTSPAASTVAIAVLELDQVPPVSPFEVYNVDPPLQIGEAPESTPALASGLMVIDFEDETGAAQPLVTV